jgi:hypothetical protein
VGKVIPVKAQTPNAKGQNSQKSQGANAEGKFPELNFFWRLAF